MKYELSLIKSGLISSPDNNGQLSQRHGEAAVLVPIINYRDEWRLLLTKRAVHMRQHGGEVAFPGGMWECGDHFPVTTALREAQEEVAMPADKVTVLGLLPTMPTRNNTQVTPVVGLIEAELLLEANPDEIDSIFCPPIEVFNPDLRIRTDVFIHRKRPLWAPAYNYNGYEIWGFTAGVIKILLERCFNTHFKREHAAPEKVW